MRFGSLFAGIGGFDLGLERAGMECAWQVEIDPWCRQVLAKHWPDVPRYEDVRDVGRDNLEPVDLVCGGFPCQDLSVAGRREGLDGERSGLWFEYHRILEEIRPDWVVIENVPGLLSSAGGRDFAVILRGLVELGYGVCWRVLDAQFFGVPQRRRRVFIVGHLGDGRAAEVLFERESGAWNPPPSREAGETTTALTQNGPGAGGGADDNAAQGRQLVADPLTDKPYADNEAQHRKLVVAYPDPAYALADNSGNRTGSGRDGQDTFVAYGVSENQRAEVRLTDYSRQLTSGGGKPGQGYPCVAIGIDAGSGDDISPTLSAEGSDASEDGRGRHAFAFQPRYARNGRGAPDDIAAPLTAEAGKTGKGDSAQCVATVAPTLQKESYSPTKTSTGQAIDWCIGERFGVRRLTPVECARLQGFPDDWNAGLSDTQRYRQDGNAVNVKVSEWLGRRIVEAEHARRRDG